MVMRMAQTKIEWCDKSWNIITGCSPISKGCQNCWARKMANRLRGRYGYPKDNPFQITFHPDRLDEPLHWKKPCRIFVCSMGDLFHDDVDAFWIGSIFANIRECSRHTFLILTKRPERIKRITPALEWPNNLFLGVSIENQKTADERIPILLQIPAAHHWISVEPMLSQIYIPKYYFVGALPTRYKGFIDWVICGGETGPGARPLHPDWVRSLRDQCQAAGVPFFFKSWGDKGEWEELACGHWYQKQGKKSHLLDGKEWREFPDEQRTA